MAKPKPNIDPKQIVNLQGKDFIQYPGLVELAHGQGLKSITTDLIQLPDDDNGQTAIFKAVVLMADETVFCSYGDASPKSVKGAMTPHIIRMAETRAKARALRDATNCAITAWEELEEGGSEPPQNKVSLPTDSEFPTRPSDPHAEAYARLARAAKAAAAKSKIPADQIPEAMRLALLDQCKVQSSKEADAAQLSDLAKLIEATPTYLPSLLMKGSAA